ncbi:hypothetical protein DXG03_007189 [Asterophora parasitica]|uniref:Hydrophobin n=1 Tax=Asterophora parasitica TaxID=117018 RepID=A0A9P7G4U5_9AGAR|nr:hypothetical protein DXG03_007189 [Asterophora parasitica]
MLASSLMIAGFAMRLCRRDFFKFLHFHRACSPEEHKTYKVIPKIPVIPKSQRTLPTYEFTPSRFYPPTQTPSPTNHFNMFSKLTLLVTAASAAVVLASPTPAPGIYGSCNTGSIQCCQQSFASDSSSATALLDLVGIPLNGLTGQVGTSCTPITPIGLGSGANCRQAPMCCSDNHYNGLIVVGCTPINVSL